MNDVTKMQSEKQNITKTKVRPLSQGKFNLRWLQPVFMFFAVLLFFSVAASVSAAWPPDPYAGCVGKALNASCDGATYGVCKSSNWYGCKATPSACKVGWDYGLPSGIACISGLVCPDKDNDGVPECAKASITGPAPAGATGGAYSADSYNYDCDDNDPWSHVRTPDKIASVKVEYAPEYIKATQTEKMFTPKPPFSPLWGGLKITLGFKPPKCKLGNAEGGVNFNVSLVTTDANGKEVVVSLGQRFFNQSGSSYIATVNIDGNYNIEPFIASVAAKRAVKLRFEHVLPGPNPLATPPAPYDYTFPETSLTNCAQVYGSGKYRVAYMRGKSTGWTAGNLISFESRTLNEGFLVIEPLKKNYDQFSHYVDLENHDDSKWPLYKDDEGAMAFAPTDPKYIPAGVSSCGKFMKTYFFNESRTSTSYAPYGGQDIYLKAGTLSNVWFGVTAVVAIHEFAHSFADLNDEYPYERIQPKDSRQEIKKNCSIAPNVDFPDYNGDPDYYNGEEFHGCTYEETKFGRRISRSSKNSIMGSSFPGYPFYNMFNKVSCGEIFASIKGGTAKSYWTECTKMIIGGGIIPVGQ